MNTVDKQKRFKVVPPPPAIIWSGVQPLTQGNLVRLVPRDYIRETADIAAVIYQLLEPID
jgi:hypothetical protein